MILMMALILLTIVRLLVARICAAFVPRVFAWFMDLTVLLVRAVELRFVFTAAVAVVTAMAVSSAGPLAAAA